MADMTPYIWDPAVIENYFAENACRDLVHCAGKDITLADNSTLAFYSDAATGDVAVVQFKVDATAATVKGLNWLHEELVRALCDCGL